MTVVLVIAEDGMLYVHGPFGNMNDARIWGEQNKDSMSHWWTRDVLPS
jgi:hypothetical protein